MVLLQQGLQNALTFSGAVAQFYTGPGHDAHAHGDTFTVEDAEVAATLDGVADSVAEIEDLACGVVLLVLSNHIPLDLQTVGDDPFNISARGIFGQEIQQLPAADHAVFDDLCPALGQNGGGEGVQRVGVAQDKVRLREDEQAEQKTQETPQQGEN